MSEKYRMPLAADMDMSCNNEDPVTEKSPSNNHDQVNLSLQRGLVHTETSLVELLLYFLGIRSAKEILVSGSFKALMPCLFA